MKIKTLMSKLIEFNQDLEVVIEDEHGNLLTPEVEHIEIKKDTSYSEPVIKLQIMTLKTK